MNIQERIEKIEDLKSEYHNAIARESHLLQKDFESYISDKNIPFKDRWNTFVHSPYELSHFINKFAYFDLNSFSHLPEEKNWIMGDIENELFENTLNISKPVNLKTMYGEYINEDGEVDIDNVRWDIRFAQVSDEDIKNFIMTTAEIILKYNIQGFAHQMDMPYHRKSQAVSFDEYFNKQNTLVE